MRYALACDMTYYELRSADNDLVGAIAFALADARAFAHTYAKRYGPIVILELPVGPDDIACPSYLETID